ncbi:MAG: hypothetical protein KAU21_02060, partial [Gammaproteobacteria bacterium]|nr:hypothetical protein [Gammaproteobacteria bacterium]
MSEKALLLLNAIDKSKMRLHHSESHQSIKNNNLSVSPIHMSLSEYDQTNELKTGINFLVGEMSAIQKQFSDPEFRLVSQILEEKQINVVSKLDRFLLRK